MSSANTAQIGDRVSFRMSDVFLPEPAEVLVDLTVELEAIGSVVEFSDSGNSMRAFAVVQITANQTVVLPVSALRLIRDIGT